jgi:hypothetical protein
MLKNKRKYRQTQGTWDTQSMDWMNKYSEKNGVMLEIDYLYPYSLIRQEYRNVQN